jgi:hypothetical protein
LQDEVRLQQDYFDCPRRWIATGLCEFNFFIENPGRWDAKGTSKFNWFHKIIVLEAEESAEIEAANIINSSNNQMSSRGGEASGAAAPGPWREGRPAR